MEIINEKNYTITGGMANALKKGENLKWARVCNTCGFNIPSYSGAYPKRCPICQAPFANTNEEYIVFKNDGTPIGSAIKKESTQINEADDKQKLMDAKKWIIKNVEITGKNKKDVDELEAMRKIMKLKTFKDIWKTLEKDYHFDKSQMTQLKMDLVDIIADSIDEASLNTFQKHQKKIALDTLKMSDTGASIMGGMNKDDARSFLMTIGYSQKQIDKLEECIDEAKYKHQVADKDLIEFFIGEFQYSKKEATELIKDMDDEEREQHEDEYLSR